MIHWLYRYIFRGIGIVFLIGVITLLYLTFHQFRQMVGPTPGPTAAHHQGASHQVSGEKR